MDKHHHSHDHEVRHAHGAEHKHHPHDHNHAHDDHLHSHVHGDSAGEQREELKTLMSTFIEGFREANDKTSYLRLANIPFSKKGADGLIMHLVDTKIASNWQIGTASPAFASRELVYMPYPGQMITERENMTFTYVSFTEREDIDLTTILKEKLTEGLTS